LVPEGFPPGDPLTTEDLGELDDREASAIVHTETTERPSAGVPPEIRGRVEGVFDGFIGNESPVQRVKRDLLIALMEKPPHLRRNYLLVGLPSVGKTELARRIAAALALPFVRLDGPSLRDRDKLFDLIDGELGPTGQVELVGVDAGQQVMDYPPFVVFVDEVHLVPRRVQESLLTMLEAADRRIRLSTRVALVDKATFVFATTQASELDKAFRSRCTLVELQPYSLAEVALMARQNAGATSWDDEIYPRIARLGRLVPRRAFEVARELKDELRTTEHPEWSLSQHLERVRSIMEIDENGLRRLDLQYLAELVKADRPLGEDALANILGTVDRDEILEEIEPALRRLELIELGRSGRVITDKGREYLASHRYDTGSPRT
jgi:Holliday junction resolvasome RuvABC ATP-dependent DNA helicase subunit